MDEEESYSSDDFEQYYENIYEFAGEDFNIENDVPPELAAEIILIRSMIKAENPSLRVLFQLYNINLFHSF